MGLPQDSRRTGRPGRKDSGTCLDVGREGSQRSRDVRRDHESRKCHAYRPNWRRNSPAIAPRGCHPLVAAQAVIASRDLHVAAARQACVLQDRIGDFGRITLRGVIKSGRLRPGERVQASRRDVCEVLFPGHLELPGHVRRQGAEQVIGRLHGIAELDGLMEPLAALAHRLGAARHLPAWPCRPAASGPSGSCPGRISRRAGRPWAGAGR